MRNLIEEGKTRLGLGDENKPFGATRRGRKQLRWVAQAAPDRVAIAETRIPRPGLLGRLGLKTTEVRVTAQVHDLPTDHDESALTGRIGRPGESVGKLVRELAAGGGDARLERSDQPPEEARTIREQIQRTPSLRGQLQTALSVVKARELETQQAIEESRRKTEGVALKQLLAREPVEEKVSGIKGVFKSMVGGWTLGNSMEIDQGGLTLRAPRGKRNIVSAAHEQIAGGEFWLEVDPPGWFDKIARGLKIATGKTLKAPIGKVTLVGYGEEPIGSITVRRPEDFVEDVLVIAKTASDANIRPRPVPAKLKLGDLLPW